MLFSQYEYITFHKVSKKKEFDLFIFLDHQLIFTLFSFDVEIGFFFSFAIFNLSLPFCQYVNSYIKQTFLKYKYIYRKRLIILHLLIKWLENKVSPSRDLDICGTSVSSYRGHHNFFIKTSMLQNSHKWYYIESFSYVLEKKCCNLKREIVGGFCVFVFVDQTEHNG